MKTGTSKPPRRTIALLVDGLIEDYEVRIWSSVGEVAKKHDVNLICFACGTLDSPYHFSSQRGILFDLVEAAVEAGHIDGILALSGSLANFSTPEKLLRTYARFSKIPLISVSAEFKGIPSITVNNAGGMHDMITHLIRHHGRRRIAFIRGPEHSYDALERFEAYKRVLEENGIPFDPALVTPGDFMPPSGERAIALLMDERKTKFDALVAANDYMALDAMNVLLERGVKIPENVAVAGFDDAKEARGIIPALSSVRQPKELGARAARQLLDLMEGRPVPERNLLSTDLVYRESCGCAASRMDDATEVLHHAKYEEQTVQLCRVYQQMITSLNVETLREIMNYAMPRLEIDCCYVSTYVDPQVGPRGGMRPMAAFDRDRDMIAYNSADFPAGQILPGAGLKQLDTRFSLVVYALFVEQHQIGYAVYDTSRNINSSIYEVLTGQLSSILRSSALIENLEAEVQQRTADLKKKTEEVERLNEELIRKNKIDSLTALYNRGAFFDYLQGEINRMRRLYQKLQQQNPIDASFCIMMIDIDHFKQINDNHGHLVGDRVLKQIGELLNSKSVFRREDTAGRFGGEEFIIVLINTTVQYAVLPAQRLMDKLAKIDFKADDGRLFKVTVSIGISQYYPQDPSAETVINRADKALYHAKETGRNRIVVYEEAFPMVKNKEDWNPSHNP
jgi:diguanylate cyclase (GGDEF)-like protein